MPEKVSVGRSVQIVVPAAVLSAFLLIGSIRSLGARSLMLNDAATVASLLCLCALGAVGSIGSLLMMMSWKPMIGKLMVMATGIGSFVVMGAMGVTGIFVIGWLPTFAIAAAGLPVLAIVAGWAVAVFLPATVVYLAIDIPLVAATTLLQTRQVENRSPIVSSVRSSKKKRGAFTW